MLALEGYDLVAQLSLFRATHTYKHYLVAGVEWKYLSSGHGRECLLLLPGAPGLGEVAFQHILRFERCYRVIAPDYPAACTTIASLIDGLAAILDHEQVETCSVVGGSYSGMIAQCLVRQSGERVRKLVLDHASPPDSGQVGRYTIYHTILSLLPPSGIQGLLKVGNHCSMLGLSNLQGFWRAYFDTLIERLTKADYLCRAQVCIDFCRSCRFASDDLDDWSGTLLIIEADNDWQVPLRERAILKAFYPHALVYTFHNTGHSAWVNEFEVFHAVIARFLQEKE